MDSLTIKSQAVLMGFNPEGQCVYSDILTLSDYYDTEHIWDRSAFILELRLHRVKGFLFDAKGTLSQEFETVFDVTTGSYQESIAKFADGTVRQDCPQQSLFSLPS
jgi:hypothetical protein